MPKYNGNIAEVDWRTNTASSDYLRRYGYVYDKLNRLSAGFYQREDRPAAQEYFEKMSYDLNGNITNLKRTASLEGNTTAGLIDNLSYVYFNNNSSNRLKTVTDSSTDYRGYPDVSGIEIGYDDNGNMTSHQDKGILQIDYNFLNLPNYLKFNAGLVTRGGIIRENTVFLYRSDGSKLRKTYNYAPPNPLGIIVELSSKVTEYLDAFQYESTATGRKGSTVLALKFVPTAEGYFNFENNKYIYNYADHLGNVRLSYFHNGSGIEVLEENNYYPFGLKHEGYNALAGNPSYQYKYNGKELQETGMYDYGARFYMPDIGRWGVVDPLAETSRRWSTYTYAYNNPIRFIDPDGRSGKDWVHNRETNQVYWNPNARSQATAGENETYLGKSGTYSAANGSYVNLNSNTTFTTTSYNLSDIGVGINLDPLIHGGDNASSMSSLAFGNNDGSYIRATPDNPFANPSSQLAYNGLIGMQMAASGIAAEAVLGAVGITGGISLSTTGSLAGDGISSLGVQTSLKTIPVTDPITYDASLLLKTDLYHNFPTNFDSHIINNGSWSQRLKDGANWYEMSGSVNGAKGTYQIGITHGNKIFHKNFVPLPKQVYDIKK